MDPSALRRFLLVVLWLIASGALALAEPRSGIGVQVVPIATGELTVLQVLAVSPADEGGVLAGDLIVAVNGETLAGRPFRQVAEQLLWDASTQRVILQIRRPGRAGELELTLQRTALEMNVPPPEGVEMLQPEKEERRE